MLKNINLHRKIYFIILPLLLIASVLISISAGAVDVSIKSIISVLTGNDNGLNHTLIWDIRIPRTLVAGCVGIALSLSGATLQGIMKNSLASPNIIGVSSGAGLAAVIILILFPDEMYLLTPVAFLGALFATLLIFAMAWRGGLEPLRLILSGVAVSAFLGAGISGLMIFFPDRVDGVINFMIGGLSTRSWSHFNILWPYVSAGLLILIIMAEKLNLLMLGDETARSLGLKVEQTRIIFIAVAALLAASSVSVAGLLGFVGLIVPHAARLMVGSNYKYLFPASALLGGTIVILCDTIARKVLEPVELPVGIIMALLGGPFFLYLLRGGLKND
ncbi:MAG: FecCD family ABC transporter permease [Rhodothermaceae bacterium]